MTKPNLVKNLIKKDNQKDSIKRSLNNYIEQLKIHFSITDDDINAIIKDILKSRNKTWWKIW